jgi:hypothetical protein
MHQITLIRQTLQPHLWHGARIREWISHRQPIPIKTHGRKARSIFRAGFGLYLGIMVILAQ